MKFRSAGRSWTPLVEIRRVAILEGAFQNGKAFIVGDSPASAGIPRGYVVTPSFRRVTGNPVPGY